MAEYERPVVVDFGTLAELTAGCSGFGGPDVGFQGDFEAFPDLSPAFGDPGNCA